MKQARDFAKARTLGVYLGVFVIAIGTRILLHGTLSVPLLLIFSWLLTATAVRQRTSPTRGNRALHAILFAATGLLLLISVIITPYGSYEAWFTSVGSGKNSEVFVVSNLFVAITTYFSAIILPAGLKAGFRWAFASLFLFVLFLVTVVTGRPLPAVLLVVGVVAAITISAYEKHHNALSTAHLLRWIGPIALSVAIPALLLSAVPTKGSRDFVDQRLSPVFRSMVLTLDPSFPLLYDAARASRDFREKVLGGLPELTDTPIFEVTGLPGQTVYLRTSVLDDYDGKAWHISDLVLNSGRRFRRPNFESRVNVQWMQIKVLAGNIDLLPNTLNTISVSATDGLRGNVVEGNYDTGFRLADPLPKGDSISLATVAAVAPALRPDLREAYLELPHVLPQQLLALARKLRSGAHSEEKILRNIQAFLAQNYTYTLSPLPDTSGEDYVSFFLFKSTGGYCVQFASAFVILARLEGIPARYATGYLAYIPTGTDHTVVTDLSSHSWPEVWQNGRGWTTWEATPAVDPSSYSRTVTGEWVYEYRIADNQNTARQLDSILGRNVNAPATPVSEVSDSTLRPWLFAAGGLLLIVAAGAILLLLRRRPRGQISHREQRFYHSLRKSAAIARRKLGIPEPEEIGWIEWTKRSGDRMNGNRVVLRRATEIAILHLYGLQPLPLDAEPAARAAARAIRRLRSTSTRTDGSHSS